MRVTKLRILSLLLLIVVLVIVGCKKKDQQSIINTTEIKPVSVEKELVDKDIDKPLIDNDIKSVITKDNDSKPNNIEVFNLSLIEYAGQGNLDGVKAVILQGVNLEEGDMAYGSTVLMNASWLGYLNIVKHLVKSGAELNSKDDLGVTALMYASQNGNVDIANYLIDQDADISSMTIVEWAGLGFLKEVKDSIKRGNDVNMGSPFYGVTALMTASDNGHIDVVKYLIENGSDVNKVMDYAETALMYASTSGELEVVKYLSENGADINARTDFFESALIKAIMYGHLDVVKYLSESGVNINHDKDKWGGRSILSIANDSENTEIIEYLKGIGAK